MSFFNTITSKISNFLSGSSRTAENQSEKRNLQQNDGTKPQKRNRKANEIISANDSLSLSPNKKQRIEKKTYFELSDESKNLYNSFRKILTTYQEEDISIESILSLESSLNNFLSNNNCFNCVSDILSHMMKWNNNEENEKYYSIILEILSILPLLNIVSIFPTRINNIDNLNSSLKTLKQQYDILLTKTNELSNITADMDEKLPKFTSVIEEYIKDINTQITNKNYDMLMMNRELENGMTDLSEQIAIEISPIVFPDYLNKGDKLQILIKKIIEKLTPGDVSLISERLKLLDDLEKGESDIQQLTLIQSTLDKLKSLILYFTEINPTNLFEETQKSYFILFDSILSSHIDTLCNDFSLYLTEISSAKNELIEIEKELKQVSSSPDKILHIQTLDKKHTKITKEIDEAINRMKNDIQNFVNEFKPYKNMIENLPEDRNKEHIRKIVDMKDENLSVVLFQLTLLFT